MTFSQRLNNIYTSKYYQTYTNTSLDDKSLQAQVLHESIQEDEQQDAIITLSLQQYQQKKSREDHSRRSSTSSGNYVTYINEWSQDVYSSSVEGLEEGDEVLIL